MHGEMRELHLRMVSALLDGEGLRGVAEIAADEAGRDVAIVLPERGLAAASSEQVDVRRLSTHVEARIRGDRAEGVEAVEIESEVQTGNEVIGYVLGLAKAGNDDSRGALDPSEVLRTAALATLTEVAAADARDSVAADVRGTVFEDLRTRRVAPAEVVRRAARLGCDLSRGAVALVAEVRSARPRHVAALVTSGHPGAIAEPLDGEAADPGDTHRVYGLLPAYGSDAAERTVRSARTIATRLRPHGPAAYSSFCGVPTGLGHAIGEAELMLDVVSHDERLVDQLHDDPGDSVYRLLLRAMAADPGEIRRFFERTVKPLVAHDRRHHTGLLDTLEAYLASECNVTATARAVYAHRHTVGYRLRRIRELTGLDPSVGRDRERLGLGIKAYRIVFPTLDEAEHQSDGRL